MINRFNGYDPSQAANVQMTKLPAGNYVGKIYNATAVTKQVNGHNVQQLEIEMDIAEGEFKDYWHKLQAMNQNSQYESQRKYKGIYRVWIPNGDGTENDNKSVRRFNGFIWSVHESNPGYNWNWNEATLAGKFVGIMVREREWEMNGNTGVTVEIGSTCSVAEARDPNTNILQRRGLSNDNSQPASYQQAPTVNNGNYTSVNVEDDELPF